MPPRRGWHTEGHTVSASGVQRRGAAHAKGLIVWMGKNCQQGPWVSRSISLRVRCIAPPVGRHGIAKYTRGTLFRADHGEWRDRTVLPLRAQGEDGIRDAGDSRGPGARPTNRRRDDADLSRRRRMCRMASARPREGYEYSRTKNPTRLALETCLAALEGSRHGLAFASGMAATDAVLRLLDGGAHVVAGNDVYGGTFRLFDKVLRRYGLDFDFVDTTDPENVAEALTSRTRLVWLETPTNPLLAVTDIRAVAEIVHAHPSHATPGRGQHLRHAIPATPTGARGRHRRALHDQVPGRSLGRGGRRGYRQRLRRSMSGWLPAERGGSGARADGLLPGAPRAQDAGPAHGTARAKRREAGRDAGHAPEG